MKKEKYSYDSKLSAVKRNLNLIDEHDIDKLLIQVNAKAVGAMLGLHIEDKKYGEGYITGTNIRVDLMNTDLTEEVNKLDEAIRKNKTTRNLLRIYQETCALWQHYYFRRENDTKFHVSGYYESILLYVLDYVINKKLSEDYGRVHASLDKTRTSEGMIRETAFKRTEEFSLDIFPNIKFKHYLNGRLDIKGLKKDELILLEDLSNMAKHYKNLTSK